MKKNYQKPTIIVVEILQHGFMCSSQMGGPIEENLPAASRFDDGYYDFLGE